MLYAGMGAYFSTFVWTRGVTRLPKTSWLLTLQRRVKSSSTRKEKMVQDELGRWHLALERTAHGRAATAATQTGVGSFPGSVCPVVRARRESRPCPPHRPRPAARRRAAQHGEYC